MPNAKRIVFLLTVLWFLILGIFIWQTLIFPSADVESGESTLVGTLRDTGITQQFLDPQYEFITGGRTFLVRINDWPVAERAREYAQPFKSVIVKGRQAQRGDTLIFYILDLAAIPESEPQTLVGTVSNSIQYPGRPYIFTANDIEYRARSIGPTPADVQTAVLTGQKVSLTGNRYFYQFILESYYEFDIFSASPIQ